MDAAFVAGFSPLWLGKEILKVKQQSNRDTIFFIWSPRGHDNTTFASIGYDSHGGK